MHRQERPRELIKRAVCALAAVCLVCLACNGAGAEPVRLDLSELSSKLKIPIVEWRDPAQRPVGIVVAIHGMTLHGATFDMVGRYLAGRGFMVVAPDMRGFGRWYSGEWLGYSDPRISYLASQHDIVLLMEHLKRTHPGLPVFLIGESLGGNVALRLAALHPELVNGVIVSSPGIFRRIFVRPEMVWQIMRVLVQPTHKANMGVHVQRRLSDDNRIVTGYRDDPKIRKHFSLYELFQGRNYLRETRPYITALPPEVPVLILQGTEDKLFKGEGIGWVVDNAKSRDVTVRWLRGRGHLLLETAYVTAPILETIETWLDSRATGSVVHARRMSPDEASIEAAQPTENPVQ